MFLFDRHQMARLALVGVSLLALAACEDGFDVDLRGNAGAFTTAPAAKTATASRPVPDARGIITYPNYQVAIARRGDRLTDVADRIGMDAPTLARYNGIARNVVLREGEVIALPKTATAAAATPSSVDITTLAGNAINNAPEPATIQTAALPKAKPAPKPQPGPEPIRHKVVRGETAFIISRLYNVSVRDLASWNGLGPDFAIREGQFLLIPVPGAKPAVTAAVTTEPGTGSPTPNPPSSSKPLPNEAVPAATKVPKKPVVNVGKPSKAAKAAPLSYPLTGSIIREYTKGKNDGIDIQAAPGTPVKAAASGTVAAITSNADKVPIIVVRHPDNLLTVYANVEGITVQKGDKVNRGQPLARLRDGKNAYVHFEVRKGFDSVDPVPFLK